jgi:hypothetical protein
VTFGAGSNITTEWNNNAFGHYSGGSIYTGTSLWNAYVGGGGKAGTYTRSGSAWAQTQ